MTYPLSQTQMGIYVTCMNTQEEGNYNIDMLYKLDDDIDIERLARALDQVIAVHPYVKLRLVTNDEGEVVFEDHSTDEFHTSIFEINDIEDVRSHLGEDYDLLHDQLFRLEIYKTQKGNYLYVDFHHIVFDGMSFEVFIEDLAKAYDGEVLEAEQVDSFRIAEQELADRQSKQFEEAKQWYQEAFGGASEVDSMPLADIYGNDEVHYSREYIKLNIEKSTIDAVCRKAEVKESMLFTAAFGLTLSKYAAEDEVLYNTAYHGRPDKDARRSFCMMVKTLPVYHNLSQTPTVVDLLKQTSEQINLSRKHSIYSYGDVATELGVKSDINFVYQGTLHNLDIYLNGRRQHGEELITNTPGIKFLGMIMVEDGAYHIWSEYQNNKYSREFILGFWAAYEHILNEMCVKENLSDIECCNADQIAQLDSFNNPSTIEEETVLGAFQQAANQYPDHIAAVFKDKKYTYRELDELTDKIGSLILSKIQNSKFKNIAEPVVSILIPRNEYMFILPLAAMKAGCAYQPLDPSYPQERLNFMVKDADAALLIADPELRDIINEYEGEAILTSELDTPEYPVCPEKSECPVKPSSLLILLYTSGSTGVPKGVMLEHHQVMAYVRWYQQTYGMTPDSVGAAYASFGFDADMMDLYTPLTLGASLCIIPEETRLDLIALRDFMNDNGVTHAFMTTQVAQQFALNVDGCKTLKHLTMGGEKMMSMNPHPEFTLHNIYGPTECSVAVTHYEVKAYEPNIPIGSPTATTVLKIVDKHFHRVPVGAAGELWINGPQVGRGYLNRPDKTAEAFVEHEGKRWYRTGDIVRYREDGNIEFVGRKDGQVKIRGFRIELKEVEAVIRDFPGIRDVTVQAFDDPNGGKYIAAYVVVNENANANENFVAELNSFILDQKPPYMVPAVTMLIEKIPLNVNQKVDKKALPKPELKAKSQNTEAPAAPLNALELELKAIIAEVVNTEDFDITDILGYVGLTSISSIRLATLIYKKYGVQVDSKSLAKSGSLQSIENEILQKWMRGETKDTVENQPADASVPRPVSERSGEGAPLTYPQTGVYLDCLKNPGTTLYNVPSRLTFSNVTAEELAAAVEATIANHQSFKLTFTNADGEPKQVLNPEMPVNVPVFELAEDEVLSFENEFMRPFNLSQGPLFRFEIVKSLNSQLSVLNLFIDIHHLITDGGSVDIIIREITSRLNGENIDTEDYSYLQFADDQKSQEGGEEYKAAKEFFHEHLQYCEGASEITTDKPKNADAIHTLGVSSYPVNMAPVEKMAKQLGVTPMSIFLAAAYYTVSRFVNNKQVYLGTISNGRSNLKTYNTTGMFVNTLALSSEIKDQTVTDFIKETAQNFNETINHEQYPFAQIAADYGFQPEIVFEYQVDVISNYEVRGQAVDMKGLALDLAKFKIKLVVQDAPSTGSGQVGGQEISIGYDEALYTPQLASALAESMNAVVEHFVSQPTSLVKNISIMSEAQREQVETLRTVATAPLDNKLFYEPIEKYAVSHPDKTALIAVDRTLTYKQFNEDANRVANALIARGVKRGDRVVILLPRTSAVMLCIFGVSKAGAAFIPCDPEYPAERINLITEDSEAAYVITTEEHMAEHEGKAILVDELINSDASIVNPNVDVTPDDLVYLIYTSGSTGRPKGVMLRHEGICNYLQCHPGNRHIYAMATEGHTYLSVTTLSFDMSLKEYGVALFNGLTLVLTDETQSNNPIELARLFKETGADIFNATPSRLLNYMELPEFCEALGQCKCILSGGEAYSDKLLARLHEINPTHIFNTYGPTEITVSSNCAELTNTDHISIGQPLLNYHEFVVDTDGNELPVGVVGELYIGGVGVAKGYNNLEKQTKERFVEYKGVRCYRSGDYCRWNADGTVSTLGRMDNQIKLRGLRIELGEVEAAICKVPGVKQTVVMVKKIDNTDHLTAYYTADHQIAIEDMKAEIGKTLTHYMVPTAYLQLDKFPLTPNGKTDLKHLPEPELAKLGGDYVAPKNKAEEDFCDIFQNILNLEKVSAADSFFELGGTSLTVTRVMIEAQNRGYSIAYSDIFKNVTPQQLAKLVSGADTQTDIVDRELTDYDYSKINALLAKNNLDNFRKGERLELGDVVLTGANGYLGIHILHDLLENHLRQHPEYKVYCLVRHGRNGVSSEARLRNLLFYYFEKSYKEMFGTQLIVIDGDVTDKKAFEEVTKMMSSDGKMANGVVSNCTCINCAAIVKHFSEGTEIEDINIGGLQQCVDFCLRTGARLIQTSTNSTGGQSVNGYPDPQINFSEQSHYFGQALTSKYTHSKFIAERIVLESIIEKGLVGKVVRLGNLAPRAVDGEFQINFRSNSAMGRLHIFQMLSCISYADAASKMEFSPIDEVARAVLLLSTAPKECCVFHPFNDHMVKLGDVVMEMARTLNVAIDEAEAEYFDSKLQEAALDPEKAKILQSMLAYKAGGKDKVLSFQKYNPYTIQVLARLGFHWNVTSWDYVQRFIKAIAAMDFFEDHR